MNQSQLEKKVKRIFEKQDFQLDINDNKWKALKGSKELQLGVYSSNEYEVREVVDSVSDSEKVFVDEGLDKVREKIGNQVSVIGIDEDDSRDYNLPSYEVIGEVAVINELNVDEEDAVKGILNHHPSVKTILLKQEPLKGEYRVGEYRKVYGGETETVHTEFGCNFKVDPTEMYFSERFATERKRVVDKIDEGDKVLVMFAGVGPFAVLAAKFADPEKVVAVEKNPLAADFLKENICLNDVGDVVEGIEGDVRNVVPEIDVDFDHIVMPLPGKAVNFLDLASDNLMEDGLVYLYHFSDSDSMDFPGFEVVDSRSSGSVGSGRERYCFELMME